MAFSINEVKLLGHVGKEPALTTTQGGKLIVNLSIATSERYKDQSGNYQDKTEWHNMVAFGRQAEIIRDYVKKGSKVFVDGKLQTRSWEKDNVKHYRTEIIVNRLGLLDTRDAANGESRSNGNGYGQSSNGNRVYGDHEGYNNQDAEPAFAGADDSDIPF